MRFNLWFIGGFNFEFDFFDVDIGLLKSISDDGVVLIAELFNIEGILNADSNDSILIRKNRGIRKPGIKRTGIYLLLNLSQGIIPRVIHLKPPFR